MTTITLPNGQSLRMGICRNCNQEKPIVAHGRCKTCDNYFHSHGYDRGFRRANPHIASAVRCDCGQPATHVKQIFIGWKCRRQITLYLCDDCWKLEQEMMIA